MNAPGRILYLLPKTGDIAIWQQGKFPARWNGQGLYVMPGEDSSYMWQGFIPQAENPHSKNPERGFLESANQRPADSTYPYFIPGSYITPRGITIENKLTAMTGITPDDMMKLQNNYFNTMAEDARGILLSYVKENELNATEKKYLDIVKNWDLMASPDSKGQTVYQCWLDSLEVGIWKDELSRTNPMSPWPEEQTTMELLKKDSALKFIDDINTPQKETLFDVVTAALKKASVDLAKDEAAGKIRMDKIQKPNCLSFDKRFKRICKTGIECWRSGNIINAVTHSHGPSWRMIVQLTTPTEAYGVYPGGQSGNPGSKYYDDYLDNWVAGKYNKLWFMRDGDRTDKNVKWVMKFKKG